MDVRTRIRGKAGALFIFTLLTLIITIALFFLDLSHHHLNVILATCGIALVVKLFFR
jgi:hypothetical protein